MNPIQWAAVLGSVAPIISAFLNQQHWSAQTKQVVAIVVAGALGAVGVLVSGADLSVGNFAALIALAIGASQAAYALIWKPTNVAPKIEAATEITPKASDLETDPALLAPDLPGEVS